MQPTITIRPDDERGYARAVKQLVGAFESSDLGGTDPALATYVAELMLHFRWAHGDGRILRWTAREVEGFLLDLAPDEAQVEDEDIPDLPAAMLRFLDWLHATKQLDGSPIAALTKAVRATVPDYLEAMAERDAEPEDGDEDERDDGPMPAIALPPVPELAAMAASTVAFQRLRAVAGFLATPRKVSPVMTLTEPDLQALVGALGMQDRVVEVERAVRWALVAEFAEVQRKQSTTGPSAALFEDSPQEAWLMAMVVLLNGSVLGGEPVGPPEHEALKELLEEFPEQLYPDGSATVEQLATVAVRLLEESLELPAGSTMGRDLRPAIEQAMPRRVLEPLTELGLIAIEDGVVTLTTLGQWGLMAWMRARGIDAPVIGDLVDASAAEVLGWCDGRSQEDAEAELRSWIAKRPVTAAREIAVAARSGAPVAEAMFAFELIGEGAEPAVRGLLDDTRLAGPALVWLVEMELVDEDDLTTDQLLTFMTEALIQVLDDDGPEAMAEHMATQGPIEEQLRLVNALGDSEHPRTQELLNAIGAHHPSKVVAKQARSIAFKRLGPQVH